MGMERGVKMQESYETCGKSQSNAFKSSHVSDKRAHIHGVVEAYIFHKAIKIRFPKIRRCLIRLRKFTVFHLSDSARYSF